MKKIKKKLSKEFKQFRDFAVKDNAISLAIGVIIGVAFKDLVDSLVKNVFTPPIGYLTSDLDFSQLYFTLGKVRYDSLQEALESNAVVIQYGLVLNALITFLITAIVLYIIVRALDKTTRKEKEKVAKTTKKCPYCFSEINIKATKCPNCTTELEK